jgi:hypothetical protein
MMSKRKKLYKAVTDYIQADLDRQDAIENEDFADETDYREELDELYWVLYAAVQKDLI